MTLILTIETSTPYRARVLRGGETVYLINGDEIVTHGPMQSKCDVQGLSAHLRKLGKIGDDNIILDRRTAPRGDQK